MKYLRYLLILLVLGLTLFFNIERLDFGRQNIIDIDSFAYVLGAVAVVSMLIVPALWRFHIAFPLTFWIGLYFLIKVVVFGSPLLGGLYTYLTITEVAFLTVILWLTYRLTRAIGDFEEAVENITLVNGNRRIQPLGDATENIQSEMFRSRHNHRPLGVVIVEPRAESIQATLQRAVQEVQQAMLNRYVLNNLANQLTHYLRRTDLVLEESSRGRFIILCPETNAEDLKMLSEYIQTITAKKFGMSVACGMATFPDEALTFEELVNQAEARLQHLKFNGVSQPQFTALNGHQSSH
jgi:GGDEF domain-containing protein